MIESKLKKISNRILGGKAKGVIVIVIFTIIVILLKKFELI